MSKGCNFVLARNPTPEYFLKHGGTSWRATELTDGRRGERVIPASSKSQSLVQEQELLLHLPAQKT
jgi:membrane protein implicated in regulation of membrane protease activity